MEIGGFTRGRRSNFTWRDFRYICRCEGKTATRKPPLARHSTASLNLSTNVLLTRIQFNSRTRCQSTGCSRPGMSKPSSSASSSSSKAKRPSTIGSSETMPLPSCRKSPKSHVPREYHHAFVTGIKTLLDALIICALSERTTLSNSGCQCLSALAKNLGTSIQPMLDYLLPAIIKLCASTKPISQRAADVVYKDIIVGSKTYHKALLHHTATAFTSENASARIYAPGWLESLIKFYGPQIDHHGGSKQVEDSVKRSVNDANSKARENSRSLYWSFVKQWPTRAEAVMSSLEPQRQRALQDDVNNPNKSAKQEKYARPGSSLAEAKAQAKKALQLKRNMSSPEILPFAISTDKDKLEPKLPSTQNERKRPPTKLKHESAHQLGTPQSHALQPNPNPASSAVLHNRPESSHHSLHSKSGSTDSTKSQESQSAQRSRPLMAAPVRRAVRVVANSTPAPTPRPNSRDGHLPTREAKIATSSSDRRHARQP